MHQLQKGLCWILVLFFAGKSLAKTGHPLAIQLYEAPSSTTQGQLEYLNAPVVSDAVLPKKCHSDAFLNSSARLLKETQSVFTLVSGTFFGVSVASSISSKPLVFLNASFDLSLDQSKTARDVFRKGGVTQLKISAFSLNNVQQEICKVPTCPKLPICVEKLTSCKLNDYKAKLAKATNVSSIDSNCSIAASIFTKFLASSTPSIGASQMLAVPLPTAAVSKAGSFIRDLKVTKLEYPVHEATGSLTTMTVAFTGNKVHIKMTVSFSSWSQQFSDLFLNGIANVKSSLVGVVFRIKYKPAGRSLSAAKNWWFTMTGLVNLVLVSILAFNCSVIIIALVFRTCKIQIN